MATNPLTPEHRKILESCQRRCMDALSVIDRAEACGMDCTEPRSVAKELHEEAQKYLVEFFGLDSPQAKGKR